MRQRYRLSHGGRIDRDRSLRFTFDGRTYEGFQGDTLASALLANGVRIVGRVLLVLDGLHHRQQDAGVPLP